MSAGFASVFGTPLAGAVFGLEVFLLGSIRYEAVLPSFLAAVLADAVTRAWGVGHTAYPVLAAVPLTPPLLGATLLAEAGFGLTARGFSLLTHAVGRAFARIGYPPLRPVLGGALVAGLLWAEGSGRFSGLGVPVIVEAFQHPLALTDFAWKLGLTALTLGCGFRGGEVTPLFFIGVALGSALRWCCRCPWPCWRPWASWACWPERSTRRWPARCWGSSCLERRRPCTWPWPAWWRTCFRATAASTPRRWWAKHLRFGRQQGRRLGQLRTPALPTAAPGPAAAEK